MSVKVNTIDGMERYVCTPLNKTTQTFEMKKSTIKLKDKGEFEL